MEAELFREKVKRTIQNNDLIKENDKIVVAVSGGPDSMCLLHVLINLKKQMKFDIVVAHVNHMIREEADSETEYVKSYCNKNNVEIFIKKIDVIKEALKEKIGTEEKGRKIRYEFFDEVLLKTKANKIAIAHNANDNAETVLMNLIRGTGTDGLKGIEYNRDNKIIRPILDCSREDIEKYCKVENLDPKIDKTNKDNTYTRNKIRNILIPFIKEEFNPNIIESLNRLSSLSKKETLYWNKIMELEYNKIVDNKNLSEDMISLYLEKFNDLDYVVKSRLILYTIEKLCGNTKDIGKIHIDDIIKLCSNNIGNKFLIPNKKFKILVKNKKVHFINLYELQKNT